MRSFAKTERIQRYGMQINCVKFKASHAVAFARERSSSRLRGGLASAGNNGFALNSISVGIPKLAAGHENDVYGSANGFCAVSLICVPQKWKIFATWRDARFVMDLKAKSATVVNICRIISLRMSSRGLHVGFGSFFSVSKPYADENTKINDFSMTHLVCFCKREAFREVVCLYQPLNETTTVLGFPIQSPTICTITVSKTSNIDRHRWWHPKRRETMKRI